MNKLNQVYTVLGAMSGTSVDGLDLCLAQFEFNKQWEYQIIAAETKAYSKRWKERLEMAEHLNGRQLSRLNCEFGKFIGQQAAIFLEKQSLHADFIASHGHTVFHQPEHNYSLQIGHGAYIAANSNLMAIIDFRSGDIAHGGQGAPLVPFGEHHLFKKYKAFLNLGGIANISIQKQEGTVAFDIAAANMVMNHICQKHFNCTYDRNGSIAESGKFNKALFEVLNQLPYYQKAAPKSLGKEDVFHTIIPLIEDSKTLPRDQLHTFCKHLCYQIMQTVEEYNLSEEKILLSGGGAYNQFLFKLLNEKQNFVLPEPETIEFKEALIFAFLGLMRFLQRPNIFNSVTGAEKQSIGGAIYYP